MSGCRPFRSTSADGNARCGLFDVFSGIRGVNPLAHRWMIVSILGLAAALLVAAAPKPTYTYPSTGQVKNAELVELSGIVPATDEHEFWGHNDSGNPAALFRFNDKGEVLQRVAVSPAVNVDWEGMTFDATGAFYVGDFGDNRRRRNDYTIYKLAQPSADVDKVAPLAARRFAYPDGKPRNCEAIFAMSGRLYLISKEESPLSQPTVFGTEGFADVAEEGDAGNHDSQKPDQRLVVREVGQMKLNGPVTDAAYSAARKELAVLTYSGVLFYGVEKEPDLLKPAKGAIGGYFGQCEAICYDGDEVIITNEPGTIWRLSAPRP